MIIRRLLCLSVLRSKRVLQSFPNLSASNETITKFRKMAPKHRENPVIMKLDSDNFKSLFTDELNALSALFHKHGYELRIAGGAVRDLLAGKRPKDLDFATTATPEQMKEVFTLENIRMINMNGEKHGTITPRINDKENFEVTTLRIDVLTDGRHSDVQFTTDWLLDANRRDLTINSMFLGLDGSVYDYFYGYEDLQQKRVRFVGDAVTRIQEDFLRILRYFRFYGRIAAHPNEHDYVTLTAIRENASGLARISGERIWTELKKILEGNYAPELLKTILNCNCAPHIGLPDDCNLVELERVAVDCNNMNAITLLSSILNTPDDALNLNARIKFSTFERELMLFIITHREPKIDSIPLRPYKVLVLRTNNKFAKEYVVELLKYLHSPHLDEFQAWDVPRFPINGAILKANGIEAGKFMGVVLNALRTYWIENGFHFSTDELLKQLPRIVNELRENQKRTK